MKVYHSDYLQDLFDASAFKATVKRIHKNIKELQKEGLKFDAIVASGRSGIAFATALNMVGDYNIVTVRKAYERNHGCANVEGSECFIRRYVILDDLICSGSTIRRIIEKMNEHAIKRAIRGEEKPECSAILLHHDGYAETFQNIPVHKV